MAETPIWRGHPENVPPKTRWRSGLANKPARDRIQARHIVFLRVYVGGAFVKPRRYPLIPKQSRNGMSIRSQREFDFEQVKLSLSM